jgi:hypothetical protein
MKKVLFVIGFTTIAILAHGQGTIAFGNGTLTRCVICDSFSLPRLATAADGLAFYVFWGPAGSAAHELVQVQQAGPTATIGTTAGVMINAPSVFAIPGTEPGQVVSLQIRAWDVATGGQRLYGQTDIRQVTLAPTAGPGTVIWQTAAGTNPNRFYPMGINPLVCPEPSTFALGAMGALFLLFFRLRRKSTHK